MYAKFHLNVVLIRGVVAHILLELEQILSENGTKAYAAGFSGLSAIALKGEKLGRSVVSGGVGHLLKILGVGVNDWNSSA